MFSWNLDDYAVITGDQKFYKLKDLFDILEIGSFC